MKKANFRSNFLLVLLMFLIVTMLGGCSPEYIQQQGVYSYNHAEYLYSTAAFKLVLDLQPNNPAAYYWLGKSYSEVGDYESAINNIKKSIELTLSTESNGITPKNYKIDLGDVYFDLAMAYYGNTDYQEAANTLNKLNSIKPDLCTYGHNFDCTEIYDNANRIKDAIDLQNRIQYSDNDSSRKYRMLGYLYLRDHNYDAAINMSAKAIEQKPDNELAYYIIGMASGEKGQYDKAIDALRKATHVDQNNDVSVKKYLPVYIGLAYYLTKNGQYDAAITAYNEAIQYTKLKHYYYNYKAISYGGTEYDTSKRMNVSFDDYPSILATALCNYNAGKYDDALKLLNDYIDKYNTGEVGLIVKDSYYIRDGYYILSVMPGSPAEKAGLQFGDKIIAINGKRVKYYSTKEDDIVKLLKGPIGTEITLKVERIKNPLAKMSKKEKKTEKVFLEKTLVREKSTNKNIVDKLARIYGLRSLIFRAQGNMTNAYTDAQNAMNYSSDSFDAKLAWGLANLDKGQYNDALKILSNTKLTDNERLYSFDVYYFLTPFPSDDELLNMGKAIAYLKTGKVAEAVNYIPEKEPSSSLSPVWKEYQVLTSELNKIAADHNEKALKLEQKGFLKEALNEYTVAFTYATGNNDEEKIINNILNLLQEYPVSQTVSEEARKYMIRGEILFKQGDIYGSLNECKKALKLAPYLPKLYYNIAELNGGLKNYGKAIKYMNNYIKLSPNASDIQTAKDEITKWEFLQEKQ